MATQITNYQCPSCTGPLQFSPDTGKLECEFCCSSFSIPEIEELFAEQNRKAAAASKAETGWGEDAAHMRAYLCPSCGAELVCEETTVATSCPYCGNPSIVPGQFQDFQCPDYVIPFQTDKEAAIVALKEYYKGKPLLPRGFALESHLEEIKGVYVPFWLYDGEADADVTFHTTRSHTTTTAKERITTTEHYQVRRAGKVSFSRLPVDASSKMPDGHMDAIEPFDYEQMQPFALAFLPGFLADKYDVTAEECAARADERFRSSAISAMENAVSGYDTCSVSGSDVRLRREEAKYALLPVWMLSTKWKEQNYLFAMNGQTGKMVGNLPISGWKTAAWFFGLFAILTLLGRLLFPLEGALLGGVVIAAVVCLIMAGAMKTANRGSHADAYIHEGGVQIRVRTDHFLHRTVSRQPLQNQSSRGK